MARQKKPAPPRRKPLLTKPERVHYIRKMMADGQWLTGESGELLAIKWKLNPGIVRADAAEASRGLNDAFQNDPALRAMALSTLQHIVKDSRKRRRNRDAIEAIKVMMGFPEFAQASGPASEESGPVTINVILKPAPTETPCQQSTSASPGPNPEPGN